METIAVHVHTQSVKLVYSSKNKCCKNVAKLEWTVKNDKRS